MGGIWVCWKNTNIDVHIVSLQHRIAQLGLTSKTTRDLFLLFGLYALAQEGEYEFWNSFCSLIESCSLPWCIIGYFNEILSLTDKKGWTTTSLTRCLKLQRFARLTSANDIPPIGSPFSWEKSSRNTLI